jgi:hypothetical protein
MAAILLLHPPLLGPAVWAPCAQRLTAAGHRVTVPDLRSAVDPPEGWYDRAADEAADQAGGTADVVAAHSGAGVLVPLVVERVRAPAAVFVDALLPGIPTSDRFRGFLVTLPVEDGRLPPWPDWWPAEELAAAVPDPELRARIVADAPRLPFAFYDQRVPLPPSWPPPRAGYLQLSPAYAAELAEARRLGWPTRERSGAHLDLATRPDEIAADLLALAL